MNMDSENHGLSKTRCARIRHRFGVGGVMCVCVCVCFVFLFKLIFEIFFIAFLLHFGSILAPLSLHFGSILGSLWSLLPLWRGPGSRGPKCPPHSLILASLWTPLGTPFPVKILTFCRPKNTSLFVIILYSFSAPFWEPFEHRFAAKNLPGAKKATLSK